MDISFPSSHTQAIATPTVSPELTTALSAFHSYYPNATLTAELVTTHHEQYIVRATANIHNYAIVSAMATATHIEIAEDRAKLRAIMTLLAQQHPEANVFTSAQKENLYSSSSTLASAHHSASLSHVPSSSFPEDSFAAKNSVQADPSHLPKTHFPEPPPIKLSEASSPQKGASLEQPASAATTENSAHLIDQNLAPSTPSASTASQQLEPDFSFSQPAETAGKSDRPTSSSTLALEIPDYSDRPIELIQEDEMPAPLIADEYDLNPVNPVAEKTTELKQQSSSKTASSPTEPRSNSKKRSSSPKTTRSVSTSEPPVSDASTSHKESLQLDLSDIIAKTSVELKRLGWSNSQGREHLQKVYGKRSRQQLTDPELIDFLKHLESQPSPSSSTHS